MQRTHKTTVSIKIISALSVAIFLSACGQVTDAEKIADAQECLNKSSSSTALACMEKVSGIETSGAYQIRCVAKFCEEGFCSADRVTQAFQQMTSQNDANQTAAALGILAFRANSSVTTNLDNATTTSDYCYKSDSTGLKLLSSLAKISTVALKIANIGASGDIKAAMAAARDDADAQALVGNSALAAYNQNCSGSNSTQSFCKDFTTAVNSTDGSAAAVGYYLMNQYDGTP